MRDKKANVQVLNAVKRYDANNCMEAREDIFHLKRVVIIDFSLIIGINIRIIK